jgi:tetratricopeptide (TPR) repeat protein
MSTLPRILIFLGLAWLAYVLFHDARIAMNKPDVDMSRVVVLFCGLVAVGVAGGILVVLTVVPRIGDALGNFFFQPGEKMEKNPHAPALAAIARGDYAGAVEQYGQILEANPGDTLAYSEIAKIACEHLQDPALAAATLERALEHEWAADDAAFLTSRLVDVNWNFQHDASSARALLLQIIEMMPGTRHAANAGHRLKEIEHQIALEG